MTAIGKWWATRVVQCEAVFRPDNSLLQPILNYDLGKFTKYNLISISGKLS